MKNERVFTIETEQETEGRWVAEVLELPGVMAYGESVDKARAKVGALAFRVLADELEENQNTSFASFSNISFSVA